MKVAGLRRTYLSNYAILEVVVLAFVTNMIAYTTPLLKMPTSTLVENLLYECDPNSNRILCSKTPIQLVGSLLFVIIVKALFTIFTFGSGIPAGV